MGTVGDKMATGSFNWMVNREYVYILNWKSGSTQKAKRKLFSSTFKRTIYYHPTIPGLVLIEYIGDETVAVDFCHENATSQQKKRSSILPNGKVSAKGNEDN